MNDTAGQTQVRSFPVSIRPVLSMLPCFVFFYLNSVMLFALLRKPLLLESPRYVLFGHLLLTDSLQLMVTMLLYVFAALHVRMNAHVCIVSVLFAAVMVKMSPLCLAVMSLERYVAICFPLRHAGIATSRRTGAAVAVMWTVGSLDSLTQLFVFVSLQNSSFTMTLFCSRYSVFQLQVYSTLHKTFTMLYFGLVSVVIVYTYIAVMITVKSASSNVHRNTKAHKTVLLHVIQLCLYLTSTLFDLIHSIRSGRVATDTHTQYALFVGLIIFPKCLSPFIYGFRDPALRRVFKYYFTFGIKNNPKS